MPSLLVPPIPFSSLPLCGYKFHALTDFGALFRTKVMPGSCLLHTPEVYLGDQHWLLTGRNSQSKGALGFWWLRKDG